MPSLLKRLVQTAVLTLAAHAAADIDPHPSMLRWPDVSKTHIVFVYANDLWLAPRAGGVATPLAGPAGMESFPRFSADGTSVAFVGNYEGNTDLYTVAISPAGTAGPAVRCTHHPAGETLCDWTPDGRLLFLTNGFAGLQRQSQLWITGPAGGMPEQVPVPYAGFGAISPDATWLAYTPHSTDTRTWKRYRGGMATDVWLFNLKDKSSRRITDWEGTDTIPMWVPGGDSSVVYYLSDAGENHRLDIWSYTLATGEKKQVTRFKDFDVRWPSIGPGDNGKGEIIFQLGAELRILDLATGKDRAVSITIPGDHPSVRERLVNHADAIRGASISPSGKRVALEARGDLWSAPAKEGVVRALTRSNGVYERDPAWSPDARWIAYFSDESGEYELWVRPSDAKPPEKKDDDKTKDDKTKDDAARDADKPKDDEEKHDAAKDAPALPAEPRKLTDLGPGFRWNPAWSPDSKHIAFIDKAGSVFITDLADGKTVKVDTDPTADRPGLSWSHDSAWLAYTRADEDNRNSCLWIYNLKSGDRRRVTDPMFDSASPAFDRKGDWLYFRSARSFASPVYSDIDSTFIYNNSQQLFMVPLRADAKSPWLTRSDEETIKEDKKDAKGEKKDDRKDPAKPNGKDAAANADDPVSGTWEGSTEIPGEEGRVMPLPFTLTMTLNADGSVDATGVSALGQLKTRNGTFDRKSGELVLTFTFGDAEGTLTGVIKDDQVTGTWVGGNASGKWSAKRTAKPQPPADKKDDAKPDPAADKPGEKADAKKEDKKDEKKELKIDFDGFEARAIALPVGVGSFSGLVVTDDGKLVYTRSGSRGSGEGPSIKIYDPHADEKEEKTVVAGAGGFELSADGKKLLVFRGGGNIAVMDAAAGGGKSTTVPTGGMTARLDPRAEWAQVLRDVYRLQRDFFYEPTMHGTDWKGIYERYAAMLPDCATREDVNWVIAEMISELNIGHAYVTGPGDVERARSMSVGLLGCDFELVRENGVAAYRIARVIRGAPYDTDARGPLDAPGVKVKEGDFLLAVNGVPVDPARDPWAAFIDTAGRPTTITVNASPVLDGSQRDVAVTPIPSDAGLRFRAWIDAKRRYVHDNSGGKVGYVYVPNTGVDGQNELYRQFFGERGRAALIIDERWNGGGQIPTRFIELLNRPVLNYWAIRDGKDWVWPPDAHNGPKCMLINGLAGSGGDMFPHLFRQVGLGPLIGTRTWGGLVGITGMPPLIDGGAISVPNFGYYKKDGTWGIEGHGVDPDIELLDDPALMQNGGDPQLDKAISLMLEEVTKNPWTPPKRPASPDRSGMGIPPEQR